MSDLPRYPNGRVQRLDTQQIDPDDEVSDEWVAINGRCSDIPANAMDYSERTHYQDQYSAMDQFGRYLTIEWADQPDWYDLRVHSRGWIPLAKENDRNRGSWARSTKTHLNVEGPDIDGRWTLAEADRREVEADLRFFRMLMEKVGESPLMDLETHIEVPPLFDYDKLSSLQNSQSEVHEIVMEARRSALEHMGWLAWWTASVPRWNEGLTIEVTRSVMELELSTYKKTGYLFKLGRVYESVNFGLLVKNEVPFYYPWSSLEMMNKRLARLDPRLIEEWYRSNESNEMKELWVEDIPLPFAPFDHATHYDEFLQLKIDPYCRPRKPLPVSDGDGELAFAMIDRQGWRRRGLAFDESPEELHKLYHHVVVQSKSKRKTTVIFQRFHPKPRKEILTADMDVEMEDFPRLNEQVVRERFKCLCAPSYGQKFDNETGVERSETFDEFTPMETISKFEEDRKREMPALALGSHLIYATESPLLNADSNEYDATAYGRTVGPRVTSPHSDHSSERREYDSTEPMAFKTGWARSMARDDWGDGTDLYVENRNGWKLEVTLKERIGERYEDALDNYSVSSEGHDSPRSVSPTRGNTPSERGHISFPIRQSTPPPFRRNPARGEYMVEFMDRRVTWLNEFVDWGRAYTYESCLWRVPFDEGWNPEVLDRGYLIIGEDAEFRLRFQIIANPAIRFPRHVLEVALERGIPFIIGYKRADCDIFRPKSSDDDYSRGVAKAISDGHAKGAKISSSPSIKTMYAEYKRSLGRLGDMPQARSLVLKGGVASWIVRAYLGLGIVKRALKGPSAQVTVFHGGANDTGDDFSIDVTWDEVSEGDYESIHGYIPGPTREQDRYIYPTDEMLEEFSDHYHREWNPFCENTFKRLKAELEMGRGKAMTRGEWKRYFQSSNRGQFAPKVKVGPEVMEEGRQRLKGAIQVESWNKRRIADIAKDIPHQFHTDF
ncbi:hypothetical protein R3P38DRAFT_3212303 [Favolaschia claudopus]|uniref:Uncharacterized protein n=1 Tax=Favolaschia claudopus TaxID=2862362 RepID=A0AAW0AEB0_9AGAR